MDILQDVINKFRSVNGVKRTCSVNAELCDRCKLHCLAMARVGEVYPAPVCYLEGFVEIVTATGVDKESYPEICSVLIFDVIDGSKKYREALLSFNEVGYYIHIEHYRAYITVRGR